MFLLEKRTLFSLVDIFWVFLALWAWLSLLCWFCMLLHVAAVVVAVEHGCLSSVSVDIILPLWLAVVFLLVSLLQLGYLSSCFMHECCCSSCFLLRLLLWPMFHDLVSRKLVDLETRDTSVIVFAIDLVGFGRVLALFFDDLAMFSLDYFPPISLAFVVVICLYRFLFWLVCEKASNYATNYAKQDVVLANHRMFPFLSTSQVSVLRPVIPNNALRKLCLRSLVIWEVREETGRFKNGPSDGSTKGPLCYTTWRARSWTFPGRTSKRAASLEKFWEGLMWMGLEGISPSFSLFFVAFVFLPLFFAVPSVAEQKTLIYRKHGGICSNRLHRPRLKLPNSPQLEGQRVQIRGGHGFLLTETHSDLETS